MSAAEPGHAGAVENAVRENLTRVLGNGLAPEAIEPDVDLADDYGLTSMKKVVFLMAACDDTGVALESFTEPDVAAMRTLRDVTSALARHTGAVA
ncbi:acyl carrier protein [Amycolatopsis pigmentata]|uniref:Acyl carrier protein n=1 Tax=Amycolatopsis pigmentata TaxID=450801 RepID=A0ABW5G446_9PSEU